ncbi:TonB-dependent receptor domain-containing protein [Vibrio algicola]|uniref:TonB-dependent receptor n=1 Tax=Vibrio algicola TaxID=2662262 RepID=A0A5Q0TGF0_9VIBR|nr:TonB-dependent receptor [Vibrio algicola]
MKKTLLAASIMTLCTPLSFSYAAEAVSSTSSDATQASNDVAAPMSDPHTDVMLVTATKRTDLVTNLVAPVIEITKADIEKSQANTMQEVLRQLPGIQFSSNGGYNQPSRIYVRGSSNVVVLFNGMRLGSATLGFSDISQLPLAGVEKIEYIRGARAAVYGADASAGVINIITRGEEQSSKGKVEATGGSNGYQSYTANAAIVPTDDSWLNLTTQYQRADGYDVATFGDSDRDGFENTNVIADMGTQLNDNWLIRLSGYYHQGRSEYDYDPAWGVSWDRNKTNNYNVAGQVIYVGSKLTSNLSYANSQDQSESQHNLPSSTIVTKRNQVSWRNNFQFNHYDSVGFGAEYINDDVGDSDLYNSYGGNYQRYEVKSRDNKAGYLTLSHNGEVLQTEGSVRFDDNEQFGDKTTWQLGAGWRFVDPLRLTANVGTGFKAPTFNDLYYPGYANPDLKPEESTNYEVALEGDHSWINWRLAGFYNDVDNRISCQSAYSTCINDSLTITGVEWTGQFETGLLSHNVSLEYLKPEDKATGEDAIRIARQNLKWQVGYQAEVWQVNMSYVYQGDRKDNGGTELDAYSLVDLAASYDITEQWKLSARIDNLLDSDYETAANYISPERSYYGSIAYQF